MQAGRLLSLSGCFATTRCSLTYECCWSAPYSLGLVAQAVSAGPWKTPSLLSTSSALPSKWPVEDNSTSRLKSLHIFAARIPAPLSCHSAQQGCSLHTCSSLYASMSCWQSRHTTDTTDISLSNFRYWCSVFVYLSSWYVSLEAAPSLQKMDNDFKVQYFSSPGGVCFVFAAIRSSTATQGASKPMTYRSCVISAGRLLWTIWSV